MGCTISLAIYSRYCDALKSAGAGDPGIQDVGEL